MGVYENPRVALQVVDDSMNAKCDTLGGLVGFRGRAVLTGPGRGRAGRGCGVAGKMKPGMATPLAGSRRDPVAAGWRCRRWRGQCHLRLNESRSLFCFSI